MPQAGVEFQADPAEEIARPSGNVLVGRFDAFWGGRSRVVSSNHSTSLLLPIHGIDLQSSKQLPSFVPGHLSQKSGDVISWWEKQLIDI